MTYRRTILAVLAAAGMTVASTVLHGKLTGRWSEPVEMTAQAERFAELPGDVGPWKLIRTDELGSQELRLLECRAHAVRTYQHSGTGELVNAALVLGPPGPISVHRPEICYSVDDFEVLQAQRVMTFDSPDGQQDTLWAVTLKSQDLAERKVRVYYGWSAGQNWSAAKEPRFSFGHRPWLMKIQVAGELPGPSDDDRPDVCLRFLQDFLPVVRQALGIGN